ncbi:MAG: DUF3159 domain-containing protein [Bifidobacteriaceae bacterium]|nr:DUF3159 domain-containing protein [Bifidobacteriaceae bacterium]
MLFLDDNPNSSDRRVGRRVVSNLEFPSGSPRALNTGHSTPQPFDTIFEKGERFGNGRTSGAQRRSSGKKSLADIAQSEDFSIMDAIGGVRGIIEAVAPSLVFLVLFITVPHKLGVAVVFSGLVSIAFVVWRLVKREQLRSAIFGLVLACIYLASAWFSHSAKNYYTPAFILDFVAVIVLLISLACRFPLLGVFIEAFHTPFKNGLRHWARQWRSDLPLRRSYVRATWAWAILFAFRLVVEVPFWWADDVKVLGILHLALGLPLYVLVAWLSWVFISPEIKRVDAERRQDGARVR